jgi:hypothetical protein
VLLVVFTEFVPGLFGLSLLVGDEVARVRLSYVLPGDEVAAVTR